MVTKEELLARKATLEADLLAQQQAAAAATQEIQDGQRKLAHSRDMINALSGAKQDVEHWLAKFPADPPALVNSIASSSTTLTQAAGTPTQAWWLPPPS